MKTCGECKNCRPIDACGCDCECLAKAIEVSQEDEIVFYGDNDEPCENFEPTDAKQG